MQVHDDAYYSDDVSTFGDRIVVAREILGMDSQQLARKLGIKLETLQDWEEDRAEPRANKLQMLAGVLNVSIIWLMSGQGEGVTQDEDVAGEVGVTLLEEIVEIRRAQAEMSDRLKRLERRLRALAL